MINNKQYQDFFKAFSEMLMSTRDFSLEDSRKASKNFFSSKKPLEPMFQVLDKTIRGVDDNQIPIRILVPIDAKKLPVLLFFHKGGWCFGGIEETEQLARKLAKKAQCIVVVVEYRLAPESRFPKGLLDCYEVTKWVNEHAEEFSGDPKRVAVGGESAGANLAASVALMSRDKGYPSIKCQLLLCPVTTNDLDAEIYRACQDQSFITLDAMKLFWSLYLEKMEDGNNPYASPLKAESHKNLPPACVVTAEHDPLFREGENYAKRLQDAGVKLIYKHYDGVIHTFMSLPIEELPIAKSAIDEVSDILMAEMTNEK
jgi:acetyl esterase